MKRCLLALGVLSVLTVSAADGRTFEIDGTSPGRELPNVQQTLVLWHLPSNAFARATRNREHDVLAFSEYAEVMGATGGNADRDCFRNPSDRSVLDDYDFTRLVSGCRGLLRLGLKPYLKLGNVPQKFSDEVSGGDFHMNIRPPNDFAVYGRYMKACADALLAAFGREELLTWRFAVLTEFENPGWFKDVSGDPEKTFRAYCRLYETTVESFVKTISPDLTVGVHAMAVTEGGWDERRFLRYAGEHRLPLKFVTASFYDAQPGRFTSGLTLPKTIAHLREAAEAAGYTNLYYGVDEGRILCGRTRARKDDNLNLRVVGDTYQAAYDARLVKQLLDAGAEYFASWGFLSGPSTWFEGLPSVSFHVARETAAFKGMRRLPVSASGAAPAGVEAEALAAIAPDARSLKVMAYAFTNDLFAAGTAHLAFRLTLPAAWKGRPLKLVRAQVDDDANWFDEWRADRRHLGIGDDAFSWSPDDPAPMSGLGLTRPADRERFVRELHPRYRRCAELKPETRRVEAPKDGILSVVCDVPWNAALFLTVMPE